MQRLAAVHAALSLEPGFRLDLSNLQRDDVPVVILALMNRGVNTIIDIADFLEEHSAPYDLEDVDHFLFTYSGPNPAQDLWFVDSEVYRPRIIVG